MSRTLDAATIAALQTGIIRPIVLVKIVTPTFTLRMSSDNQDTAFGGETYQYGTLGNISPVNEAGMSDSGISLTFSGVDLSTLALSSRQDFLNCPVTITILLHDEDWQPIGTGIELFDGYTSSAPSISYGNSSEVSIQCMGKFDALNRPRSERYSDAEQQRKHPGDLGLQYAANVANKDVVWPASSFFDD